MFSFRTKLVFIIFQQSLDVIFDDKQISFILYFLWISHKYVIEKFQGALGIWVLNLRVDRPFEVQELSEALINL